YTKSVSWQHYPESGGKHHFIPLGWVDKVEDNKVVLTKNHKEVFAEWQEA
ncbi:DUF2171 domain-containing protein, partial [Enterobacter hormaechei]